MAIVPKSYKKDTLDLINIWNDVCIGISIEGINDIPYTDMPEELSLLAEAYRDKYINFVEGCLAIQEASNGKV
tara:strand:+ start:88 stop:306 length:219 start_codon:yes stop_codon:yes gene_type:complete